MPRAVPPAPGLFVLGLPLESVSFTLQLFQFALPLSKLLGREGGIGQFLPSSLDLHLDLKEPRDRWPTTVVVETDAQQSHDRPVEWAVFLLSQPAEFVMQFGGEPDLQCHVLPHAPSLGHMGGLLR
jgi:hypothetical protein